LDLRLSEMSLARHSAVRAKDVGELVREIKIRLRVPNTSGAGR
jgi:hypothetical protein